ncbi:retrovirus-related Pol polyprotein from transposon 297 [Trichonephila clavipes]|nr:retrovirus-related Pol polyprotein from transposon 297 [Trichonephila clavipes]
MPNEYDSNQISHVAVKSPPFWKQACSMSHILNSVNDLVLKPPENGKYKVLKKRLIDVHSGNEDSKIRTLLQGLELGNARPSQLLTRMRSLAGDSVGELRLPNGPQTILAALNENLDQLSTVAVKINDLAFPKELIQLQQYLKKLCN